ncbi:MAG: B12-binding domain-containing radical SAM protein [Firmicutes bacterium HGW-Firmicutes-7]|nr:MAG: B12-binding domain-containing radical SAM protein [Firmicutes bacterium HGW-Firmicutes-7]
MKVLLVGINAKFIHSNLAIRYMQKVANSKEVNIDIVEYTINQRVDEILSDIFKRKPDVLCFSCYLWNIEIVLKIMNAYKKISKNTPIVLGGPEVSYEVDQLMAQEEQIDFIIYGEGEETFKTLVTNLTMENPLFDTIEGLVYRKNNLIISNAPRKPLLMDDLPFVYEEGLGELENKIIYYESIRGCPFNCQYCLSSIEKGVRYRSFEKVKNELQFFLNHKVLQVKFVDRTFNCKKDHAMSIWSFLHLHDNGTTNFHFEISADLLDAETIAFLNTVRPGLFQFEIGVQSTHEATIEAIKRKTDFVQIVENVKRLKSSRNIHLHLDLIVGLPHENYSSFEESFNNVYCLKPEQLQIGFLKVLKGSGIYEKCEEYGLKYRDYAPYEVLLTKDMSYLEIQKLKMIEEMVEVYYNSGHYYYTVLYLEQLFNTPFKLFEALAEYWEANHYHQISHSKISIATIIKDFGCIGVGVDTTFLENIIKLDWCLHEKVKKFPEWLNLTDAYSNEITSFYRNESTISQYLPQLEGYSSKQISRMVHIEVFDYDMIRYQKSEGKEIDKRKTALLFNYYERDKMRHNPRVFEVNIFPRK